MSRIKVLVVILLYSILTASILHGFKMITTLWTVAIIEETFKQCPKPKGMFTEIDYQYFEIRYRNLAEQGMDIPTI